MFIFQVPLECYNYYKPCTAFAKRKKEKLGKWERDDITEWAWCDQQHQKINSQNKEKAFTVSTREPTAAHMFCQNPMVLYNVHVHIEGLSYK